MNRRLNARYWLAGCIYLATFTFSCNKPEKQAVIDDESIFFSLSEYFNAEAVRLQQLAPTIEKTVSKNGETERHVLQITDWKRELDLFIESDINKPAWRNSYRADSSASAVMIKRIDPDLRTERIVIKKKPDGSVGHIIIINQLKNALYEMEERLEYFPDSLYRIDKRQWIRFIGENHFHVSGVRQ